MDGEQQSIIAAPDPAAAPPPETPVNQPNTLSRKMKLLLLTFGILELPIPCLGFFLLFQIIQLNKNLGTNSVGPFLGVGYFLIVLVVAISQIGKALFPLRLRLSDKSTKRIFIWGIILTILSSLAFGFFILKPIYDTISEVSNAPTHTASITPTQH